MNDDTLQLPASEGRNSDYALLFDIMDARIEPPHTWTTMTETFEVLIPDGPDHTITITIPEGSPLFEDLKCLKEIIAKGVEGVNNTKEY